MSKDPTLYQDTPGIESVAFVDLNVTQSDTLIQGLQVDKVFLLNDQTNAIEQITQTLKQYQNLDSVHIFSHGSENTLQFANGTLSEANLDTYQNDLAAWADTFSEDGDLFFYGCNIAADGHQFIEQISQLTQADVAASDDVTGHASLGGDWDLEVTTGETGPALTVVTYGGILPSYNGNTYELTTLDTWDGAQAQAQSLGGNLVTINDAAEETWLRQTFSGTEALWIGLNDSANEGQFEWTSDEAVTYLNWAPFEPNNFNGNEDAVTLNGNTQGQWNDLISTAQRRGIIEIDQPEPPANGDGDGLKAEYYNNQNFTNLALTRTDATVDFNWGSGSPASNIGADTFSVRWTGQIEPRFSETYTFRTTSDDGVRLWVNNQLIIDQFVDQAPTNHTGTITLQAGQKYDIRMDYYENGGGAVAELAWSSDSQVAEIVPQSQLFSNTDEPEPPPNGDGDGLKAEYYNNQNFTNLALTRTDATVDFNWGGGSPASNIGADTFSVRWTGQVEPRFSETYTFRTTSDDGVRLWVNNQLIIDQFVDQAPTNHTGTITLQAGQKYDIRMDYYENGGGAVAELAWSSDSQVAEIVPQSQLFSNTGEPPAETYTFALQNSNTLFVNEAAGVATVTAVRTGGTQDQATVEYTLNELGENSATGDVDFIRPTFDGRPNTGQIVFAPGAAEASFTIPIVNDTISEGNESFGIGLQNPNGDNTLGAPRTKLVTILDDDALPTISLAQANLNVAESSGSATVTVQRSGNTDTTASVTYSISNGTATLGEDYGGPTSGTINFATGQTSRTIDIPILEDSLTEGNETFSLSLESATNADLGAQQTTTISILDNDLGLGNLTRTTTVSGLTQPTTLDWTPDGRYLLVAEKGGAVKVIDNGVLSSTPLIDISAQVNGTRDRGLLGLAIHPEFPSNPYVYLLHTYDPPETAGRTGLGGPDGNGNRPSRLVRVTVNPNTMVADPNSLVVLAGSNSTWEYTSSPTSNSTGDNSIVPSGIVNGTTITAPASEIETGTQDNDPDRPGIQNQNIRDYLATDSESHSIGDLEFGADGYLYLTNGDGTAYNFVDPRGVRVQDINNLSGKLLRIDPITGEGVATNPFYNGDGDSNQSKVFYSGLRNPFRFAFDPVTDLPVIGDVGWVTWEEINTGPAGSNFGWPYLEGPNPTGGYQDLAQAVAFYNNGNRNNPGDTAALLPLLSRTHGAPDSANSIMVGDFYNSNTLMFGDVINGTLYAATLDSSRQVTNVQVFDSNVSYVVDMKMGPDNRLYGVNLVSGSVFRWDPDDTEPGNLTASFNDFSNTAGLNLNGNATGNNGDLRLTAAANSQTGTAFLNQTLQVTGNTSFSTQFQFQITGGQGTNGADGFAFVLQSSGAGADAVGAAGSGVGYGGIGNSLAIEFDTYLGVGDPNNNHISILQDGDTSNALFNADTTLDLNSGSTLTAWIDYDGTADALSVYLSNNGVKPLDAVLSYNVALDNILGADAYVGFSAGTGGLVNNHDILNWSFDSDS